MSWSKRPHRPVRAGRFRLRAGPDVRRHRGSGKSRDARFRVPRPAPGHARHAQGGGRLRAGGGRTSAFLEPVRDYPARHASTLLVFEPSRRHSRKWSPISALRAALDPSSHRAVLAPRGFPLQGARGAADHHLPLYPFGLCGGAPAGICRPARSSPPRRSGASASGRRLDGPRAVLALPAGGTHGYDPVPEALPAERSVVPAPALRTLARGCPSAW